MPKAENFPCSLRWYSLALCNLIKTIGASKCWVALQILSRLLVHDLKLVLCYKLQILKSRHPHFSNMRLVWQWDSYNFIGWMNLVVLVVKCCKQCSARHCAKKSVFFGILADKHDWKKVTIRCVAAQLIFLISFVTEKLKRDGCGINKMDPYAHTFLNSRTCLKALQSSNITGLIVLYVVDCRLLWDRILPGPQCWALGLEKMCVNIDRTKFVTLMQTI